MTATATYRTIEEIKRANRNLGHHFFDADTLRFFRSRIGRTVYGGRYFVTSEQFDEGFDRLYTVREALPDGEIATVGDFQGYSTSGQAVRAIKRLISGEG